jgi:hypothetical protein
VAAGQICRREARKGEDEGEGRTVDGRGERSGEKASHSALHQTERCCLERRLWSLSPRRTTVTGLDLIGRRANSQRQSSQIEASMPYGASREGRSAFRCLLCDASKRSSSLEINTDAWNCCYRDMTLDASLVPSSYSELSYFTIRLLHTQQSPHESFNFTYNGWRLISSARRYGNSIVHIIKLVNFDQMS